MEALTKEEIESFQAIKNSAKPSEIFLLFAEFFGTNFRTLKTFHGPVRVFDFFDVTYLCENYRNEC